MPTVDIDTDEGHDMKKDTETRIREIQAEAAAIDDAGTGRVRPPHEADDNRPRRQARGTRTRPLTVLQGVCYTARSRETRPMVQNET